jgi:cholesterol 7-dehydrogenase
MHLVEFAENAADLRHFAPLHGKMKLPWTRLPLPFVRVQHTPSWEADAEQPHLSTFRDTAVLEVFGRVVERSSARATITFLGPGGVVRFVFEIPNAGEIVLYQTHTPVAPLAQHVRFRWWAGRRMPRPLVSYVIGSWISQWRADVAIWESKVYRQHARLVPEDGPVHAMRRWYAQFYDPRAPG